MNKMALFVAAVLRFLPDGMVSQQKLAVEMLNVGISVYDVI